MGVGEMVAIPWADAWHEALYGPEGFYRRQAPSYNFATATHGPLGAVLAEAIWRWADRLGMPGVVDVGAGRGELLAHLHAARPGRPLLGCDVVDRPAALPAPVRWLRSPGGARLPDELRDLDGVLVVAHEWLDVVPCVVAQVDADGRLRLVLVDPATGAECLGEPLGEADRAWCERYWPGGRLGDRVEVGRARDAAWADLLSRISWGAAVAVDYGHDRGARPREGTLTAYRGGVQVAAVPDGSCDITAHVAVGSLPHDRVMTQAEALALVGMVPERPRHFGAGAATASADPPAYLRRLERAASLAELTRRDGFGAFRWVLACLPGGPAPGAAHWPP